MKCISEHNVEIKFRKTGCKNMKSFCYHRDSMHINNNNKDRLYLYLRQLTNNAIITSESRYNFFTAYRYP
jgi:hypothetical protein